MNRRFVLVVVLVLVIGGGENMWFTNDACHYLWKSWTPDSRRLAFVSYQLVYP